MNLIDQHREALNRLCSMFNVDELYAFGSILTTEFNPESDIDLIVSINAEDPIDYAENYFNLKFELEKLLQRKIDLLEQKAIKNKIFEQLVDQQKILVYAGRSQSLA